MDLDFSRVTAAVNSILERAVQRRAYGQQRGAVSRCQSGSLQSRQDWTASHPQRPHRTCERQS